VFTGRRTCNSWFAYSIPKKPKDVGTPPSPLSDEELDDYDRLPRDYDKEVHDNLFHNYICECLLFIIAIIPGRDPLRLVVTNRYKPRRLHTPYFIDAWEENDNEEACELELVHLDKYAKSIKKCAVWRPQPRLEEYEEREGPSASPSKIRWCTTHAKSGIFTDTADDYSNGHDSSDDNYSSDDDDDDNEG